MAISAYIWKIVEKDPFLRLQMRAKEMFNCHHFFPTNKQYVKIKLMHNETNRWSIFWVKMKHSQNLDLTLLALGGCFPPPAQ